MLSKGVRKCLYLPRREAAASLKLPPPYKRRHAQTTSSAARGRGLIEAGGLEWIWGHARAISSAARGRGLIEARRTRSASRCSADLPRREAAASLKLRGADHGVWPRARSSAARGRGLIEALNSHSFTLQIGKSSAARGRGLIEARGPSPRPPTAAHLPRREAAASLKLDPRARALRARHIFRGERPRPH